MLMMTMFIMQAMWMIMHTMKFKQNNKKTMNLYPFECGFNMIKPNAPMSIQFSLISFIFLIFDIELTILITAVQTSNKLTFQWNISLILFLILLMISMSYEMMKNSMQWNK